MEEGSDAWGTHRIVRRAPILVRAGRIDGAGIFLCRAPPDAATGGLLESATPPECGGALAPLLLAYRVKLHLGFVAVRHREIDHLKTALAQ